MVKFENKNKEIFGDSRIRAEKLRTSWASDRFVLSNF